jgi:hypothetical protein
MDSPGIVCVEFVSYYSIEEITSAAWNRSGWVAIEELLTRGIVFI